MIAALLLVAANPNWICEGPNFDSSCVPAKGGDVHCFMQGQGFYPTSYAESGRIAYCAMPAARKQWENPAPLTEQKFKSHCPKVKRPPDGHESCP